MFDFIMLNIMKKNINVVFCKIFVKLFMEYFNISNNCFLDIFFNINDFNFVVDMNSIMVDMF